MKKHAIVISDTDKPTIKPEISLIDENLLKSRIYTIRGLKVMLDADLADIYGYTTKAFNQQVKNNIEKFAEDFRFQLKASEMTDLRSKFLTANLSSMSRSNPYAFTEQGIYMLMTVLYVDRQGARFPIGCMLPRIFSPVKRNKGRSASSR